MKFIEIQIVETASHRIERTINMATQNIYKKYRWHRKYERRHGWTNLLKIYNRSNCCFLILVNLTIFSCSFFLTFDIMVRIHICLTRSCDNVKFQLNYLPLIGNMTAATQLLESHEYFLTMLSLFKISKGLDRNFLGLDRRDSSP